MSELLICSPSSRTWRTTPERPAHSYTVDLQLLRYTFPPPRWSVIRPPLTHTNRSFDRVGADFSVDGRGVFRAGSRSVALYPTGMGPTVRSPSCVMSVPCTGAR